MVWFGVWASGHLVSGIIDVELEAKFGASRRLFSGLRMLSSKPREFVGLLRFSMEFTASCMTGAGVAYPTHHIISIQVFSSPILFTVLLSPRYFTESTYSSGDLRRDSSEVAEAGSIPVN